MNNTTNQSSDEIELAFIKLNIYTNIICSTLLVLNELLAFVFFFTFSVMLIHKFTLIKDQLRYSFGGYYNDVRDHFFYNDASEERGIMRLSIAICLSLCGFCIILNILVSIKMCNIYTIPGFEKNVLPPFTTWVAYSLESFGSRFIALLFAFSIYSIVTLLRYLIKYGYYFSDSSITYLAAIRFLLSFFTVAVIALIGLFRQVVFFAFFAVFIASLIQFIKLIAFLRSLKRRYFQDFGFETYQFAVIHVIVIALYQLFFGLTFIFPIFMMLIQHPHSWLNVVLHNQDWNELHSLSGYIIDGSISFLIAIVLIFVLFIQGISFVNWGKSLFLYYFCLCLCCLPCLCLKDLKNDHDKYADDDKKLKEAFARYHEAFNNSDSDSPDN